MEEQNEELILPTCEQCGATVPPGKTLCWCCEHTQKLHRDAGSTCDSDDACNLNLEA